VVRRRRQVDDDRGATVLDIGTYNRVMSPSVTRSKLCVMAVSVAIGVAGVVASARQTVTLEALLAAPFPSEIVAASEGGHVAWVLNDKGSRNVWVASAPTFTPRQITSYSGDDGQDITALTWTRNGRSVLYVRGGGANRAGEIPNPAMSPQAAEQAIWIADVSSSTPRKLATGNSPAPSNTGDVAYLSRGQVWATNVEGTEKPTQLFTIRGTAGNLRWSPDGGQLAFVSSRGDHAFVGIYNVAAKSLKYLDPSIDVDGNPVWSRDSTRIAFTRTPATGENFMFAPRREALPWSIRLADVATGRSKEIWKASSGPGSVFQGVLATNQVMWTALDRLIFPWERDGWIHLYSVSLGGGQATQLTRGAFEVEHVTLTPDRRSVVYSSNQNDIDRRHIWKVSADGGATQAVTTGTGADWMQAVVEANTVAFIRSTGKRPAHVAVVNTAKEGTATTIGPAPAPVFDQLVDPQPVTITATDGIAIPGQLFVPRDLKSGERRPAVLFFHGGSRRQMLLAWHYRDYYHNTYALNQFLASRGYIVLSVNYRSGTGYGLNFREALNYGATGASEFNDVMGAGLYMKNRPDVDPRRIGIYGGSYGGYLTAHALARASDLFAAGVDIHGVHDWNVGIRTFMPNYNPGPEIERRNFLSSPLNYVKGWRSPVLLIHGDDDRNVSFAETVTLAEALRKQGVTFESLVIPDEIHGFLRNESWLRVFRATADFFDRHLAARRQGSGTGDRGSALEIRK
jgi:dipeptidyl aminopeptidase/acylaminoacyl peptidase